MASPKPPDEDQKRKDALQKFHDQNLKQVEELQKKSQRGTARRKEEQRGFEERGSAAIQEEATQLEDKKKRTRQWRADDARHKEEIERDKERRKEETRHLEEMKQQKREYEEKHHKFIESFRAHEAAKVQKERKKYERDQELKAESLRVQKAAFDAKQKADSDELRRKNVIESDGLRERDAINREFRDLEQKLFGEEARGKARLVAMGPQGKPQLDEFMTGMAKKRAELRNAEQLRQRQREQDTAKKKTEAEADTRRKKAEIDRDMWAKKAEIERERAEVGKEK